MTSSVETLSRRLLPWLTPAFAQLETALKAGSLGHAWLISGLGGVGKLNLALALARRLLGDETQPAVLDASSALAAMAAHVNFKTIIVVDGDVDVYDPADVMWALGTRVRWHEDVIPIPGTHGNELDPSSDAHGVVAKVIIDATLPRERHETSCSKHLSPTKGSITCCFYSKAVAASRDRHYFVACSSPLRCPSGGNRHASCPSKNIGNFGWGNRTPTAARRRPPPPAG